LKKPFTKKVGGGVGGVAEGVGPESKPQYGRKKKKKKKEMSFPGGFIIDPINTFA
jgi:hypothetical protein